MSVGTPNNNKPAIACTISLSIADNGSTAYNITNNIITVTIIVINRLIPICEKIPPTMNNYYTPLISF